MDVKAVETIDELRRVYETDIRIFGDQYEFSYNDVYDWWRKDPGSCIAAIAQDGQYLGYISFWSVSYGLYRRMISSPLTETDIANSLDCPPLSSNQEGYIYIGGLVFSGNRLLLRYFLIRALELRFRELRPHAKLNLCVAAFTMEGLALITKLSFQRHAAASISGQPVFTLSMTLGEMLAIFKSKV